MNGNRRRQARPAPVVLLLIGERPPFGSGLYGLVLPNETAGAAVHFSAGGIGHHRVLSAARAPVVRPLHSGGFRIIRSMRACCSQSKIRHWSIGTSQARRIYAFENGFNRETTPFSLYHKKRVG